MNVLVIGGGGREHALCAAIALSPRLGKLFVAPGNPGMAAVAERVALDVGDHGAVLDFCRVMGVALVVVGPEVPLVAGIADDLRAGGVAVFGPSRAAAQLEASKAFTKEICDAAGAPTAAWSYHDDEADALAAVARRGGPLVVKADGLAAGKGVTVAATAGEAEAAVRACFAGTHGAAGASVVLEDVLRGREASLFCLCAGERAVALPPCRDHKRVGEGDTGPNTGGMGAFCPVPDISEAATERAMARIVRPVLAEMVARGTPFTGVLYAGLMVDGDEPSLIEFNVRFGDPEAQVLLPLLGAATLDMLAACASDEADMIEASRIEGAALCVTLAAEGYPGTLRRGDPITGIEDAEAMEGVRVFHAGTDERGGKLVTNGGRVLTVTGTGATPAEARERAYAGVGAIAWPGMQHRRDIGAT